MPRMLRPLPPMKDASRRSPSGDDGATHAERPRLTIIRPEDQPDWSALPPHELWHDDPLFDPVAMTRLDDWPHDQDFEPLLVRARAVGDTALVVQLEEDRALCARARALLSDADQLPQGSSA